MKKLNFGGSFNTRMKACGLEYWWKSRGSQLGSQPLRLFLPNWGQKCLFTEESHTKSSGSWSKELLGARTKEAA